MFASDGVIEIVKYVEKSFRLLIVQHDMIKSSISQKITRYVVQHFSQPENYRRLKQLGFCHAIMAEISFEDLHEIQLIRKITDIYSKIRLHSHTKKLTLQMQGNAASVRHKLSKIILFKNI